jgi:Protein of unknown function (DUF1569)
MKNSVFLESGLNEVKARMAKLTEDTQPQWGIMKVNQMMRHIFEANKIITGEIKVPDKSRLLMRTLFRYFVMRAAVPSKRMREKNPPRTFKDMDVVKTGIQAGDLETEKNNLLKQIVEISKMKQLAERHPLFGKMSHENWGYFMYSHLNYHLTQFGA